MKLVRTAKQKKHNAEIFKASVGYDLDYNSPKTFNEKLNWLKFNYRDPLITVCSGKDTVREYVVDVLGEEEGSKYLVNLVGEGIYDSVNDIDFTKLPDKFVLKVNNGSGKNIICNSKCDLIIEDVMNKLTEWTRPEANHYYNFYEWGYKNVQTRIVCEEFLGNWGEVRDYKFFCFNGEPRFVYVSDEFDSNKENIDMDYLNLDWSKTGFIRKSYKPPVRPFKKPESLMQMINIAKKLSNKFPFVRVDFFDVNNSPKVVEMTFYPAAGYGAFENKENDIEMGSMLYLPKKLNHAKMFAIEL